MIWNIRVRIPEIEEECDNDDQEEDEEETMTYNRQCDKKCFYRKRIQQC